MDQATLITFLDEPERAAAWLGGLGLENLNRAQANLVGIAESGMTLDLLTAIASRLEIHLVEVSDPDMALNNLERFVRSSRSPLALGSLIERDADALPILLQMFSTSQHLSDIMVTEPESYDLLRITEGQPVARGLLVEEIGTEIGAVADDQAVMALLRQFKRRETLRIAYGDFVVGQRLDTVTRQISYLADAVCEAALLAAQNTLIGRFGVPRRRDGKEARFVVLALGKLGGKELNYSSDIDLMFLYDEDGKTDGGKPTSNQEYFDRLSRSVVKLLTEATDLGTAYRVDLRLRPEGSHGPVVVSFAAAQHYYENMGRTWERQAFVKARPCAGDLEFGKEFLDYLEPWIYRRYLSRADITGIKALKRRIEKRTIREGGNQRDVKTGHGGIRDIEFVIQFLQLLNGGDLQSIRTGNTLDAIEQLAEAGCLTMQERGILTENYVFLRQIEHLLQIMFDLQTHMIPESDAELRKLALRMGYSTRQQADVLPSFKSDFAEKTELNHKILDHLLHDAFMDDEETDPVVDLVLDPDPRPESIRILLESFGFQDVNSAYHNLMTLATEKIEFLSTRRCRHFLAAISPRLLLAISRSPDPDATLVNLCQVSDSLGGKGVLWELFSVSSASLELYVRLCASSPYLSGILTSHPGMIDELMDSLVLDRLPDFKVLREFLTELCRGAEDVEPILHGFKNSLHLRVGVRDILGKEEIESTTAALSDVAEVCLQEVAMRAYEKLARKYGYPSRDSDVSAPRGPEDHVAPHHGQNGRDHISRDGQCAELVILGMGKLGGREPNYHSDLDIIFLYDCDGMTRHRGRTSGSTTTNQHFFSELGQRVIKLLTRLGPQGRLYEVDARLRPTGKSGPLAVSFAAFARYFDEGDGQLWERQALCRARPIFGTRPARQAALEIVRRAITHESWLPENAREIKHMRQRMEETASRHNLKRGPGGTVDVEFSVQMLQLRYARSHPEVLVPGTLQALDRLFSAKLIDEEAWQYFSQSYRFLRGVEARLRLMNTTARHDIPKEPEELEKLTYLLRREDSQALAKECQDRMRENRVRFDRLFDSASASTAL